MATFPARRHVLEASVRSLVSQVDELHLVLNEYAEVPSFLAAIERVVPVLPAEDHKDVGKFVPIAGPDDLVFLADDDLFYAPSYCDRLAEAAAAFGPGRAAFGIHGRVLECADPPRKRRTLHYRKGLRRSTFVDLLGTGTLLVRGRDLPPLDVMRDARTFVDERFARWAVEQSIPRIAIARPWNLVRPLRPGGPSIYDTVTRHDPPKVRAELERVAGKSPEAGSSFGASLGFGDWLFGGGRSSSRRSTAV